MWISTQFPISPCPLGPNYPLWLLMSQRPPRYPTTSLRVRWLWKSWEEVHEKTYSGSTRPQSILGVQGSCKGQGPASHILLHPNID